MTPTTSYEGAQRCPGRVVGRDRGLFVVVCVLCGEGGDVDRHGHAFGSADQVGEGVAAEVSSINLVRGPKRELVAVHRGRCVGLDTG